MKMQNKTKFDLSSYVPHLTIFGQHSLFPKGEAIKCFWLGKKMSPMIFLPFRIHLDSIR